MKKQYAGRKVDVVGIADIANGDYTSALKGWRTITFTCRLYADADIEVFALDVYAVLHIAAPLPGKADPQGMLDGAVGGAINIIRQAVAQGVKRVVLTSTILAILDLENVHKILYSHAGTAIKETGH